MPSSFNEQTPREFEIDRFDEYAQYALDQPQEIHHYLGQLARHGELISAYLDDGRQSFLTTLLAIDTERGELFFDPPQSPEQSIAALQARQITFIVRIDRVKVQFRLNTLQATSHDQRPALKAAIPSMLLRLQRREHFRLEPPGGIPIRCSIAIAGKNSGTNSHDLPALDISGGGISLEAPIDLLDDLEPGSIFKDCRLEIPEECVLQINLQVRKVVEISSPEGPHTLRIGCSFVGVPAMRLGMIERYITRIERERTARNSGLVD
ncbi:flagellar brake protein [Dechloromonas sp. ARDL1]